MVDAAVLATLDLETAARQELRMKVRLLPPRLDHLALVQNAGAVAQWLAAVLPTWQRHDPCDILLASKPLGGLRPLTILGIADSAIYRALINRISANLPDELTQREPFRDFKSSPLSHRSANYITVTDVVSYYEYVDHELLARELISQTGDALSVSNLLGVLQRITGKRVSIPQINAGSDVLGDTYIDPVRRRLHRRGVPTSRYSDDFILEAQTLGQASVNIDLCAAELRRLGLVISDRKTLTHRSETYRQNIGAFEEAEKELFEGDETDLDLLSESYEADESDETDEQQAGDEHQAEIERAARRAWDLWASVDQRSDSFSPAVKLGLLARALPALGLAGVAAPLEQFPFLISYHPGLTPELVRYVDNLLLADPDYTAMVIDALTTVLEGELLGDWQRMWIAQATFSLAYSQLPIPRNISDWLLKALESPAHGVAATVAAAIGQLAVSVPSQSISALLDTRPSEWRTLIMWGLHQLDPAEAQASVDNQLDRLLLDALS